MRIKVVKATEPLAERKKRVCAYARVSTDSEEQENSLANQTQFFQDFIAAEPDWEFVGVYADQGISGFKENRPAFLRMISDAKAGKIDLIVVKSISRFARNTETVLKATRELKQLGIGVYFILQGINTLTAPGELLLTIQGAFAQAESEGASALTRMTTRRKFEAGIRTRASERTFGYTGDPSGDLCIVPDEAEVVRLIFNLAAQGMWASRIKQYLNMQRIAAPLGGEWDDCGIARVLRNEMYKGDLILQKTYKDRQRRTRENHGEVDQWYIKDDHPAIVDPQQWDAVQVTLGQRRQQLNTPRPMPEKPRSCFTRYPLTDMLYCPYCGNKLIHKWGRGSLEYWACKTNLKVSAAACKGVWLPAKTASEWEIQEPVVVVPYLDEFCVKHFTAYPKAEYEPLDECQYK